MNDERMKLRLTRRLGCCFPRSEKPTLEKPDLGHPFSRRYYRSFSIAGPMDFGSVLEEKRLTTEPWRSTRNLVKFHWIRLIPRRPRLRSLRKRYSGWAAGPFTSILANMGKLTP